MGIYVWDGEERELFDMHSFGPRLAGRGDGVDPDVLLCDAREPVPGIEPLDPAYYGPGQWGHGVYAVRYEHGKYPYAEFHHIDTYDGFLYAERTGLAEALLHRCPLRAVPIPVGGCKPVRKDVP